MQQPIIKPFITGATGFIGGRIAERLWIDHEIISHCMVRNFSNSARIARLPVKMIPGDILDISSIEKGIEGCDTVFHCAYGNTDDPKLNSRINEEGTTNLCEIALKFGVKKFIYISSVAVYGPNPPPVVNEQTPTVFSDDDYGNSKIRAEKIGLDFFARGLPLIIIRPAIVFGPFSPIWTVGVIKRLLTGGWQNVEGLNGMCNPVYIDDLIESLFLSIETDKAVGETFVVAGAKPITWNQYFSAYIQLTDVPSPKKISENKRKIQALFNFFLRANVTLLRKIFEPQLYNIHTFLQEKAPYITEKIENTIKGGIRNNEVRLFSQQTVYSIDKAKKILGYYPRAFETGMQITADWLKHHRYI